MLLFRSEEHAHRWNAGRSGGRDGGAFAVLTAAQAWGLARAWYSDRMEIAWRRKTASEAQAAFVGLGLGGDFWRLDG